LTDNEWIQIAMYKGGASMNKRYPWIRLNEWINGAEG
jgi:hypothetical protein